MYLYIATPLLALGLAAALMPAMKWLAFRLGAVASANTDVATHTGTVSLFGGAAIFVAFLSAYFLMGPGIGTDRLSGFLVALALMLLLGLYKDVRQTEFSPYIQLAAQTVACALVIVAVLLDHSALTAFVAVVAVIMGVTLINGVNFLDVMDGLAGTITVIIALFMAAIGAYAGTVEVSTVGLSLAGATAGFLVWNRPPASVFMGDMGSFGIGVTLFWLGLRAFSEGTSLSVLALIFSIPLIEFAATVIIRAIAGRSPIIGDASHLSLSLLNRGMSPWLVLAIFAGLTIIVGSLALSLMPPMELADVAQR